MKAFSYAWKGLAIALAIVSTAAAQDVDLAAGGWDQVWGGTAANNHAGKWLDLGALSSGDNRRDLIIGAPGEPGVLGRVYVIFGGPVRSGVNSLSNADAIITGAAAGDLFGASTAAGNILQVEGTTVRNLVVGAPAAFGGRGAVYLFAASFHEGDRLTTANAVFTVIGKPGDGLGSALATADLNNDGYREIIMGARQSGHIYAIRGGASLSGTRDLSNTAADISIFGTGVGDVMAAGDVNGDGVQDLVVGSPVQNAAYLLYTVGGGSFPKSIDVPAAADAVFTGRVANSQTGASIRVTDVDGDGGRDILISAPLANGPIDRPNAGETYLIWGGRGITSRSLANADVTFYGAGVGYRTGSLLASGDVNRDTPDDIVFMAPGTSDGGQMHVYYGRSKSAFGSVGADGRRTVDLSVSGQIDRRLIGDPSQGAMTAGVVYEVTGEGARDLVVGLPDANGGAGAVYFTISPKLRVSPSSITQSAARGTTASVSGTVTNPSPTWITYNATTNQPWLTVSPGSGSANLGNPGTFTVTMNTALLAAGTYTGTVNVTSTSRHLEMTVAIPVSLTVTSAPGGGPISKDFNGDGFNDLIWQHMQDGWLVLWTMNGPKMITSDYFTPNRRLNFDWEIQGVGDFNGDSKPDLLWYNKADGSIEIWMMNGSVRSSIVIPNPGQRVDKTWRIVAVADMNFDGKPDIVWRNMSQGWLECWLMDGPNMITSEYLNPDRITDANWKIIGAMDVNADGKQDLIWFNEKTGYLIAVLMNGLQMIDSVYMDPDRLTDFNWIFAALTDLNGDGKTDIIWQHKVTGTLVGILMDGYKMIDSLYIDPSRVSDLNWKIMGPR